MAAPSALLSDPVSPLLAPAPGAPFRFVLGRDKQARLAAQVGTTPNRLPCPLLGCGATGLAVVVVDTETTAVLCPRHELVSLAGEPIKDQPMFVTAAW